MTRRTYLRTVGVLLIILAVVVIVCLAPTAH